MKVTGSQSVTSFTVTKMEDIAEIRFYENAEQVIPDDGSLAYWIYDEYIIHRPWYENIESDIEANYSAWLQAAKAEELQRTGEDIHQMRADIDFMMVMSNMV